MYSLKQLIRQPIRSVMGVLTLMLSGTILCLSVGLYYSAVMTVKEATSAYTTIALPTDRTETVQIVEGDKVWQYEKSAVTNEAREWMNGLADTYPEVLGTYHQQFISAYSDGLHTLVSAMEDGAYGYIKDKPYTNAAFVVTIESIGNDMRPGELDVTARIDEALLLHDGYKLPEGLLHFTYYYFTEDELSAADLEIGGTYIVFGVNYSDEGLALKEAFAEVLKIPTDEIDWDNLNYDVTEYINEAARLGYDESDVVAKYEYNDHSITLTASKLEAIASAWMFVQNPAHFAMGGYTATHPDGTVESVPATEEEIKAATLPTIVKLKTDINTFMDSEEGRLWREKLEQYSITNQSVPVLGTDLLESIFQFHQNKAVITGGRSFTGEEYKSGSRVCIISETLALANGLQVGDTIPLTFYQGYASYLEKSYNPPADVFSSVAGFSNGEEAFQIIGIYRQSDLWADTSYAFTPNTVFVPNKAITCDAYTDNKGIFYTLVLKNGSIDKLKDYEEAAGCQDIFYYYDQGYSGVRDSLADFLSTSRILLIIGAAAWTAVLILFFALYVARQKQTAGMMLSLGSGRRRTIIHILCSTLTLVLIAAVVSGILGYGLLGGVIDRVYSASGKEAINEAFSASAASDTSAVISLAVQKLPQISAATAAVQFVIFALVTWIYGRRMLNKKPLILMKHKEN